MVVFELISLQYTGRDYNKVHFSKYDEWLLEGEGNGIELS